MASITLRNIAKRYDDGKAVVHGIDLDIRDGEFIVFVGPSGCGKSTLLRMIAGLEDISGGELHIGDRLANAIAPAQRGLAMVFQSYALYPHMTVFENMAFSLRLAGHKGAALSEAVGRAAAILQITDLLQRKPKELSGGQRQRVAIGRAIVRKPEVFLFDEPLSNLDASLRVQMRVELSRLHRELGATMVYVTHDQVEAMTLGERIVVINGGRIEQVGTPHALYNHPGNLFVAGFLGAPKMNFMAGEVAAAGAGMLAVRLAGGALIETLADGSRAAVGDKVTLGVRAEHMQITRDDGPNQVTVQVGHVEYLGDQTIAYTSMPGDPALIAVRQNHDGQPLHAGDTLRVHLPAGHCHVFDAAGAAFLHSVTIERRKHGS
ncbi:MAG: sn-glycerol-3-phosphate ABC transporter ATP-binding protein UgpC [Pseudomonadota bacterium]